MSRPRRFHMLAALSALLLAGCAARGPQTWRLVPQNHGQLLVPPGVKSPAVAETTFTADAPSWHSPCAPAGNAVRIRQRGKRLRVTVTRDVLLGQPPGWLAGWTASAEARQCLPLGAGLDFANRILDAVPLDPSAAWRLLRSDSIAKGYIDLGLESRLQVRSPIMQETADPNAPIVQVGPTAGSGHSLQVTVDYPNAILGWETSWYTFQPRPDHNGAAIVPVSAERTIAGKTVPAAAPLTNYLQFAHSAAFYRLFYKADTAGNSVTEIVIAAPTRQELERRTQAMNDPTVCRQSDPQVCMVIPRHVAVNAYMMVTVNGAEVRLGVHSLLRSAIEAAGGRPRDVLAHLAVSKPFAGKLTPVVFDRSKPDIFDLLLLGGESISWK